MDYEVRFHPSQIAIRVAAGTSLLDAARGAGLPLASACSGDGVCARCGVAVLAGGDAIRAEAPAEARAKRANRIAPDLRLACRVAVEGDLTVTTSYW